jgi:hypothetical protein
MRAYILHVVYRIGGEIPGIQDADSGAGLGGSMEQIHIEHGTRLPPYGWRNGPFPLTSRSPVPYGASSTFAAAGVSGGERSIHSQL